jgi:hypothetical protein
MIPEAKASNIKLMPIFSKNKIFIKFSHEII